MNFTFLKKNKNLLKFTALLAVMLISFYYIKNNTGAFKKIYELSLIHFFILSLLFLSEMLVNSYFFQVLLKCFNTDIKFSESFNLTILNNYSKYIIPKSGNVARGLYLKKVHNFSYKNYILSLALLNLILIFSVSLCSIAALLLYFITNHYLNIYLFIFFIILNISSIIIFFLKNKILNFFRNNNWCEFSDDLFKNFQAKNLFKLINIRIISIFISSLSFYFTYLFLFKKISLAASTTITSAGQLSPYISITPASLGIKEGIMSYVAKLTQLDFTFTMTVASLSRAISIFWILLLGIFISHTFFKKIRLNTNK